MELTSNSLTPNSPVPEANALGIPGSAGPVPGPNRSPHLRWSRAPTGTKSFAVICTDVSAPSKADDANRADRAITYAFPRADFHHWALVDIPASMTELAEGLDSEGLTPKGKPSGKTDHGVRGINSYTEWFASDPNMRGEYGGYDGPWPPFNDERVHQYVFAVYALDIASLGLPEPFRGPDALRAMEGHVLARASITATYSLNPTAKL
jgi:Raf kinase inhibitor-like YbhB/YbcL family protein